jgi:ferredoxin--NADP+ reductase
VSEDGDTTKRRNVEILREYALRAPSGKTHRLELRVLRSSLEILGEGDDGPVAGVRVGINRLTENETKAVATGEDEVIDCGLVLRSIGYRGTPLPGIPFDPARGLIRNKGGRVRSEVDGSRCPGEFVVEWIKRGPSHVIGTNKKDANDTVARIVEDEQAGELGVPDPSRATAVARQDWIDQRVPDPVTWQGWQAIDTHESELGEPIGGPRVKLVRLEDVIRASRDS